MFELSWQDMVLMAGNLFFFIALIPSILGDHKPSKWTSLVTAITLTTFSIVYYTLSLMYGMFAMSLTALGWWILYFQKQD